MSEMDKFVLQYSVEMKDAIERLEKLNQRVATVKKETGQAGKEFAEFSKGASDEIGKLIPGVDKVTGAVRVMGAEFAIAATAVAALGVGVKSVMDLRQQYGAQRVAGMATGVSGLRMEEYQRKFVKNSNGNINREQAQNQIQNLSEKLQAAYADPTRMGTEARTFRLLGIDVGERGKNKTPFNDSFSKLAEKFSKMKPEQVQGIAKAIGMNEDFALAMQRLGPSVGKVTELTEEEIKKRTSAEESLKRFNGELAVFNEKMNELEISLGQKLLPAFSSLLELINKIVNAIPDKLKEVQQKGLDHGVDIEGNAKKAWNSTAGRSVVSLNPLGAVADIGDKAGRWLQKKFGRDDQKREPTQHKQRTVTNQPLSQVAAEISKATKDGAKGDDKTLKGSVDSMVDALDKTNREATNNSANMQQAINMFAGAVATFSNAIDEKQAWAAWAGEVGRAGGLSLPSGAGGLNPAINVPGQPPTHTVTGYNPETQFDKFFEKESKAQNVPVELLKRVTRVESQFNPNAKSEAGALGLMQVMPSNMKGTGTTNLLDPAQNIKAGAQILAENLKAAGGNVREALLMYHGGLDRKQWGPKTLSYPDKVLGEAPKPGVAGGESRDKIQLRSVQQNIAARLGVPLGQLQLGGVNRGDVSWAASQMKAGVENQIFDINKELMTVGLPQQTRSKLMTELREQQSGLNMLKKYSPQVEEAAQPGERSITIGERAIVININGVQDPETTGKILQDHLQNNLGDIVNRASDGLKY